MIDNKNYLKKKKKFFLTRQIRFKYPPSIQNSGSNTPHPSKNHVQIAPTHPKLRFKYPPPIQNSGSNIPHPSKTQVQISPTHPKIRFKYPPSIQKWFQWLVHVSEYLVYLTLSRFVYTLNTFWKIILNLSNIKVLSFSNYQLTINWSKILLRDLVV